MLEKMQGETEMKLVEKVSLIIKGRRIIIVVHVEQCFFILKLHPFPDRFISLHLLKQIKIEPILTRA